MKCQKHPDYKGAQPPKVKGQRGCTCLDVYINNHQESSVVEVSKATGYSERYVRLRFSKLGLTQKPTSQTEQDPVKVESLRVARHKQEGDFWKRRAKQLEKKAVKTAVIVEAMHEALEVVKPFPPVAIQENKGDYSPEELLILLSDCQAGTKVVGRELGNQKWDYNTDVFRYRLKVYLAGIMEVVNRHRLAYPVDVAHVWLGGDLIEGDQIFPSQQVWIDSNAMAQFFMVQYEMTAFLMELARRFKHVHVYTTPGNHGRMSSTKANTDFVNWEYVLYRNIQWLLKDHTNLDVAIPYEWYQKPTINGWDFCFVHGEEIVRHMGFPWYGQKRTVADYHMGLAKELGTFDYFVHGHHHTPINLAMPFGEVVANGSFVGHTRFTTKRLSMGAIDPQQQVLFVHKKMGLTARYWIRLNKEIPSLWEETMASSFDDKDLPIPHEDFVRLVNKS